MNGKATIIDEDGNKKEGEWVNGIKSDQIDNLKQ